MSPTPEREFVFNVVWTGSVFPQLRYLVASQLAHSDARYRFVANDCPSEQIELMERFAQRHPARVIEVLDVSPTEMVPHGVALDRVRDLRDDGEFFCFVDADIAATGPFVTDFARRLDDSCAAVTSGRGVWAESDVVPPGHPGVSGEYFYSQDGYLFGSPHFAMYRREPLEATLERWSVGFHAAGASAFTPETATRLREAGHDYWLYDTAKVVNILLQEDGHRLCHDEHPNLLHIGGVSHYLAPTGFVETGGGEEIEPDWSRWRGMTTRFEVSRFTATVLRALSDGRPAPAVPGDLDAATAERLESVRSVLTDVVASYDPMVRDE